jgi:hypothetical protein
VNYRGMSQFHAGWALPHGCEGKAYWHMPCF